MIQGLAAREFFTRESSAAQLFSNVQDSTSSVLFTVAPQATIAAPVEEEQFTKEEQLTILICMGTSWSMNNAPPPILDRLELQFLN